MPGVSHMPGTYSWRMAPCGWRPEYVIIRKLQFYREGQSQKHLRDMSRMLASLGPDWDRTQLEAMIREQGLQTEWQRVLAFEG
jgi:hypothetical protein